MYFYRVNFNDKKIVFRRSIVQNTMARQLSHRCILDPLITTVNLQDLCCYYDRFYWRTSDLKIELACSRFCFKNTINFPQCPLGHRRNKINHNNDFVNSSKFVHLSQKRTYFNVLYSWAWFQDLIKRPWQVESIETQHCFIYSCVKCSRQACQPMTSMGPAHYSLLRHN